MSQKLLLKLFFSLSIMTTSFSYAQELIPFNTRKTFENIRGDLKMIGNSVVGLVERNGIIYDPNADYNVNNLSNGNAVSAYIDIDGDPTTFSSSSAELIVESPNCSQIVYAGLYWSANYYMARIDTPLNFIEDEIASDTETNVRLIINNGELAQQYTVRYAEFSEDVSDIQLSPVTSYLVTVEPADGCTITNGSELAGNIAVIQAGATCSMREKVLNAQNAGAVGVVLVSDNGNLPRLTGAGSAINIPAVVIGNDDVNGENLYTQLDTQTEVVLGTLSTTGNAQLTDLPERDPRKIGPADFRNVKLRTPGSTYQDVAAQRVIWDGYPNTSTNNNNIANDDVQYICYADVTDIIDPENPFGTYTVADMNATQGFTSVADGTCGGWMLVVTYENPLESKKYISTKDGFAQVFAEGDVVDFSYNGLQTLPGIQPIAISFGIGALEGDKIIGGDRLQIKSTNGNYVNLGFGTDAANNVNPINNFFNSSVSTDMSHNLLRNPASINTLGFDLDHFELPNAGNSIIANDQTSIEFRLLTDADRFSVFFNTISMDIIEPQLSLIKRVYDIDGVSDITGGNVELGDEIFYDLEIENVGNEDFEDGTVTITEVLPANTNLVEVTQVPPGVTYAEITAGTLVFNIPANLVETDRDGEGIKDAPIFIRLRVQLVSSCQELRDACSNEIRNIATALYTGELSGIIGSTDSSTETDSCGVNNSNPTNVLVNVPPCSQDVVFCGDNLTLIAGTGYDQYTWTGPGIITPVVQQTSTNPNANVFVVPNPQTGAYQVVKEDVDPNDGDTCMTLTEVFNIEDFGDVQNPILSYVNGTTVITEDCSGLDIPQILLCGDQNFELMTNFSAANVSSISWQRLSPSGACIDDPNDPCSLLSTDCTSVNWVEEPGGNTQNFIVSIAGDYRILAEFDGGCLIPFYFSVLNNDYQPILDMNPIECGNEGSVTVTNVPNNFAFSLTSGGPYTNTTGIFPITTPGDITVYAIDTAFPSCEYPATVTVPSIDPVFMVTATSPSCVNDDNGTGMGSIQINVTGGTPEYQYTLDGPGLPSPIVVVNQGPDYTFTNLLPGTYTVESIANRPAPECVDVQFITINPAPDFNAFARLFAPPTCDSGALIEIVVTSGSGDYLYDDGSGNFQVSNIFEVPSVSNPGPNLLFYVIDNSAPAGSTPCIIEVPFNDPILPYQSIVVDNFVVTPPLCSGDAAQVQVSVTPTVAGRTYLYELVTVTEPSQETIYNVVSSIGNTPLQSVTFPNVAINDPGLFYRVRITHNNTTPPGTAPLTICPVFTDAFVVNNPDVIVFDISLIRPLSCTIGAESAIVQIANITGGSGMYEWSLDNISFAPVTLPQTNIEIEQSGSYTIYIRDSNGCIVASTITVDEVPEIIVDEIFITPITTNTNGSIEITTSGGVPPFTYELKNTSGEIIVPAQTSSIFQVETPGDYIISVTGANDCTLDQQATVESVEENPLLDYADEILFCALTGQSYPIIVIQDQNGETLEIPLSGIASIVWQKLDEINCNIELQDNCPITDSSCSSDWFTLCDTPDCMITDPGEYRIIINFVDKSPISTQTYYFRATRVLGNKEITNDAFKMYPNPAGSYVELISPNIHIKNITVKDFTGKTLLQTSHNTFDISDFNTGVYFVEIEYNGKVSILKLVKE